MKIKHEIRPADELVTRYEELLNYYLSPHHATVKILLYENPLDITCMHESGNMRSTWIERHWVEDVIISTPEVKNLSVSLTSDGLEDSEMMEQRAWIDAHEIQDMLYKKLSRHPSSSPNDDDPYWSLWKKHPTHP